MKKISVITSFNKKYYDHIGKYCVSSFIKHWSEEIKLTCYVEDLELEQHSKIIQTPFSELSDEYVNFQQTEFNNRIKTFSKKAYSIIHAMENINCDLLVWIDSDVLTINQISHEFIESLCLDNEVASFMGVYHERNGKRYFSCESSFFVINKNHLNFIDFSNRYREYYDKRLTENIRRFYDGDVLGATIKDLEHLGDMRELNPSTGYKTPMPRSVLGQYFMHFKAGLKDRHDIETFVDTHLEEYEIVPVLQ